MKIGFVSGCFDWLSPGHVRLLEAATHRCDELHMLMADDETVKYYKGEARPLLKFAEREELAYACKFVDKVWRLHKVADESNQLDLIQEINPDVYFEGADATDQEIGAYLKALDIERITLNTPQLHVSEILARYDARRYDQSYHQECLRLEQAASL